MSKWIKVDESLPKSCADVLVCSKRGEISIARYAIAEWDVCKSWISREGGSFYNITHWKNMPMKPRRKVG